MHLQTSAVHMLIYITIVLWLISTLPLGKNGCWKRRCFFLGGLVMPIAFVLRWIDLGHVPLQNLFDVFLALGVVVAPLWRFCERFLMQTTAVGCRLWAVGAADVSCGTSCDESSVAPTAHSLQPTAAPLMSHSAATMAGVCVLIPAGFVFNADPQPLPPALQSPLFVPHVGTYMLAYMILLLAGLTAAKQLLAPAGQAKQLEQLSSRMVRLGFPLLTLGLLLGAVWGKRCWGDYWNWDPKELWSFATWLTFAAYLHWRSWQGPRFAKTNAVLILLGVACVILTLLWVNLSRLFPGLHAYA